MATMAYVEIQDVKYTEKQLGNNIRIYYTNGATAGSEVVSVSQSTSNWDITVQIQDSTSTANQIIAAVNADAEASALVTAEVKSGGTGTNAQRACKSATMSGGVAAASASVTIGGVMTLTADSTGTSGNSIRFKFTSGATAGAEVVNVATNDISVQIADGVSTYSQVKTALDATPAAVALVNVTCAGPSLATPALVSAAHTWVSLSGGVAAAAASVVVQDLTFAKDVTGTSGNGSTVTYTTGATAGAEVVSVSGSNISIQIENETSTATQIKAAFDAAPTADGAKASGTVTVANYANHLAAASGTITYGVPDVLTAASGTITYGSPDVLTAASGTITYGTPDTITAATGTVTIGTYTELQGAAATGTITITEYDDADLQDSTVTIAGHVLTEGVDWTAATSNDDTAESLKDAIHALSEVNATRSGAIITITAASRGTAGNAIAMARSTTQDEMSLSGALLTGGTAGATVTVAGHALVETVDWTASVDPATTAESLKDAIHALSEVNATRTDNVVNITAASAGAAGNSITLVTSNATHATVSGAVLSGGKDASTVTVNGSTFTCVAAAPGATEFSSIGELEALIEAVTGINSSENGSVVTVTAATGGTSGNSIAMSKTGAGLTLSGATLSGGLDASTVTVNGTVFTCVAATPGATEFTTIGELEALIEALPGINSSENGTVITVTAATGGTAGNSIAMAKSGAGLTLSGATLTGGKEASTVTVNGTTFTCVASAPGAAEFSSIGELEALIEALTGINSSENGTVITVTAATAGTAGNAITLAKTGTGLTVSGATLTGGLDATTLTVAGTVLTCGVDYTNSSSNDVTAESLKDAIHALSNVNATRSGAIVTVTAAASGTAGNALALATNNAANLVLSGSVLSGGTDKWSCTVSGTGSDAQYTVNGATMSGAVGDPTIYDITTHSDTALTSSYVRFAFPFPAAKVEVINDETGGSKQVITSLDGTNDDSTLDYGESVTYTKDDSYFNAIFLKYGTGAPNYRLRVWAA